LFKRTVFGYKIIYLQKNIAEMYANVYIYTYNFFCIYLLSVTLKIYSICNINYRLAIKVTNDLSNNFENLKRNML